MPTGRPDPANAEPYAVLPMLPARALTVAGVGGVWTVAHCRSRHEKRLAADADAAGFGYFLPLAKETRRSGRTTYPVYVPLDWLAGYVFLSAVGDVEPRQAMPGALFDFLAAHRSMIDTIDVRPSAQPRLITDLSRIHDGIVNRRIGNHAVARGKVCRVVRGAYAGNAGVIDDVTGKGYAVLTFEAMGRQMPFEIPVADLEPI